MSDATLKCDDLKAGKYNKPLLERQRRARINKSLEQIKDLILSNLYKNDPQILAEKSSERMDKAEILEFAVDYLKHQKLLQYAERTTRTTNLLTPHEQFVDPRLPHYPNTVPLQSMVYASHPASKRQKIDQPLPQPWMNIVKCKDSCCVPHYATTVSPIPTPPISTQTNGFSKDASKTATDQSIKRESIEYSHGVWRPW